MTLKEVTFLAIFKFKKWNEMQEEQQQQQNNRQHGSLKIYIELSFIFILMWEILCKH